jgi:hypothetical protein
MKHRCLVSLIALAAMISLVSLGQIRVVAGQGLSSAKAQTPAAAKTWTAPRTPDGQPDLQGVWANNNATPFERPKELEGRQFLTEQEVAALKAKAGELFSGDGDAAFGDTVFLAALANAKGNEKGFKSRDVTTGDYNSFWIVERDFDNRTSLIIDPPDGRVPPMLPEAEKRQAALAEARKLVRVDGPEDLPLSQRCITFGVPDTFAGYNSYYQIVQAKGYVAIVTERIHDARIIPLDGSPHLDRSVRQWLGDSRGHWEGNTLVVDTINFTDKTNFRGAGANLHLVERFTRVGADTIHYEFTVEDPTTWTKKWTAMIPLKRTKDMIFEYACHEGNEAMAGTLSGYRVQERKAEGAAKTGAR